MVELHLVAEDVDPLLQRFHAIGHGQILAGEGVHRELKDLAQRPGQYLELPQRPGGKDDLLLMDLPRGLRDVHGVVADPLEVGEGVQVGGDALVLLFVELVGVELDKIGAELVLVEIDQVLGHLHFAELRLAVFVQKRQRAQQVLPCRAGHGVDGHAALLDRKGRVLQETLVQPVELAREGFLVLALLYQRHGQLLDLPVEGQQHDGVCRAEERIHQRHREGAYPPAVQPEAEDRIQHVIAHAEDQHAEHLDHKVGPGGAASVRLRADGRHQHRQRRADGDAEDQRIGFGEGDRPGQGQRLQNTDRGRGALQDGGKGRADQNAQQGVGHARHQMQEMRVLPQRLHRAAHAVHAEHQHRKAQQDIPRVAVHLFFGKHTQDDARDGYHSREVRGGQQRRPARALRA